MSGLFKGGSRRPTRHGDPDNAVAGYLEQLHQADVSGAAPPPAALNGLGDAYLDKEDPGSAADYWRQAAEAYAREGMHSSAIACLQKVRRHALDEGNVGLLLGRAYAAKGLTADALAELGRYLGPAGRPAGRRERIEGLREIVRLAPGGAERREELAAALLEDGQREAGVTELRAAGAAYREAGDREAARRVEARLTELGSVEAPPVESPAAPPAAPRAAAVGPAAVGPARGDEPRGGGLEPEEEIGLHEIDLERGSDRESDLDRSVRPDREAGPDSGIERTSEEPEGLLSGIEIERTSYSDLGSVQEPEEELTIEQESVPPPHVERVPGIHSDDLSEALPLEHAAAGLEEAFASDPAEPAADHPAEPAADHPEEPVAPASEEPVAAVPEEPAAPPPADLAELVDLARNQARDGHREQAARNLLLAAEGLRAEERWADAIRAYRALAEIGAAKDEDLDDWADCGRQAGRAAEVLEALAVAARTRLARNDHLGARRAAEAMLLVDPHNAVAAEILERVGALPPRG